MKQKLDLQLHLRVLKQLYQQFEMPSVFIIPGKVFNLVSFIDKKNKNNFQGVKDVYYKIVSICTPGTDYRCRRKFREQKSITSIVPLCLSKCSKKGNLLQRHFNSIVFPKNSKTPIFYPKKTVEDFVIIATTSTKVTLSVTGFQLPVIPISIGIACELTLTNKVFDELIMNKDSNCTEHLKGHQ